MMIDTITFTTNFIASDVITKVRDVEHGNMARERVPDAFYKNSVIFKTGKMGRLIAIKQEPVYPGLGAVKVELSPSRFESFDSLRSLLVRFGLAESELRLSRVDYAVDLNVDIETVFRLLKVKYKTKRTAYHQGSLTGMDFGDRPEIISVYDKGFERKTRGRYKKLHGQPVLPITRVEVRHFHGRIRDREFVNLPSSVDLNPFSKIELWEAALPSGYHSQNRVNKFASILEEIEVKGFHQFYKENNKQNNFKKCFGWAFRQSAVQGEMLDRFQRNLEKFFKSTGEII